MGESRRWFRKLLQWIGQHEIVPILALAIIAMGIWGFVELADEVLEGETHAFDRTVLLALRSSGDPSNPLGPRWVEEAMRDLTALGGVSVLAVVSLSAAGFLLLQRKNHATLFLILAVGGGMVLSFLLKYGFDRPRPDLVPHGSYVVTSSFPSGHSMMSAVVYLTLGVLLARTQSRKTLKAYFLLLGIFLTTIVGVTRVYLGVHWPTDILAGWTAGAAWALFCSLTAGWLQRHGTLEAEDDAD